MSVSDVKGSLFSQQIKKLKKDVSQNMSQKIGIENLVITENIQASTSAGFKNIPNQSFILSGIDKDSIHQENIDILCKMTEEKIVKEQNQLLESMDPAIVAFLRAKRSTKENIIPAKPSIAEQNKFNDLKLKDIEIPNEILTQQDTEKWLNFDVVETNKLAWMKDIKIAKIQKNSKFEAR